MSGSLRLVFGDQLNFQISSLSGINTKNDVILMCEVRNEMTYVKHHKKKIVFLFSAMRHFAQELIGIGYTLHYVKFDDPKNEGTFFSEVSRLIRKLDTIKKVIVTEPSEYRVLKEVKSWSKRLSIPVEIKQDNRFLCTHKEFAEWGKGRKQKRMEFFYREMRKKYNVLMRDMEPEGGKWNYDHENRKPPKENLTIPPTYISTPDQITEEVKSLVKTVASNHFGNIEPFTYAVTRKQALVALETFIQERLIGFGDYQDAMLQNEPWMFHSHLGLYLNCGLLLPLECVIAAEKAYELGHVPLNASEGFIRQILGWREYIRGIYWSEMPTYEDLNFLEAKNSLPNFFWTGKTKMNCLKQSITETQENAYAHHIQRLMVLGNFLLLIGVEPKQANEWYLIVYADAYQWVELPNVSGMVLFADGGIVASKPYAASGAYIDKMSNYCDRCDYKVKQKNGPDACPFNYLYWNFLNQNREKLKKNPRVTMMYRVYDRLTEEKKEQIRRDSQIFLEATTYYEES